MKIRSQDLIQVIKGRDRGKQGRVQQIIAEKNRVLVEGINLVKRHTKATGGVRQAGIIQKELPIQVSNVILVCTHCNKPTRIGSRDMPDGTRARVCKQCQEVIE